MSDACEREQRSEKCASPKTASATPSMTLASTALESQLHKTTTTTASSTGQQQQQQEVAMSSTGGNAAASTAAGHQQPQQQQQQMQQQQQQQMQRPSENDMRELREIKQLLWGDMVREDVFNRWSQGFEFSDVEPSALVQKQGGPCAVIAPVQAYLLKIIIMDMPGTHLAKLPSDKCQSLLIEALCNILQNCRAPRFKIVTLQRRSTKEHRMSASSSPATNPSDVQEAEEATEAASGADATLESRLDWDFDFELTPEQFHERLHTIYFDQIIDVARYYMANQQQLQQTYGVLLFMYSVFLTKGTEQVTSEISDTSEPLIHSTYGYGAQSLINLMLTGRAVAHVWDNEQDVGGLKLRGICEQSDIGFITLMEQMRYCTVGSFFKNPRFPVWVMGSDTHLTVLFSYEQRLVSPETASETGRRIFKSYDPEGNNFISSTLLRDVLQALDLVSEPAYVNLMQKRLDPENLGIILLNAFMDEFFPQERQSTPDTFELMHYNGIPGSNDNNKVRYYFGSAILLEADLKSICTSNPMVTCLQTKWPNIEINWHDTYMPSLN
ncbi:ubiquitin carboxyl-terminal hydrolase MINDY-3 homolog [Drosophila busckii]|uniref:ubiquitin carboxyl-terminal hydrolase MINDY-3 homolog n=1 Tax=Drosophila busckii TaxID=30019 RepID=UPI00083E9C69|nr:ubiquitin carboxyl-terminal hydrolase MINDY-3 homolog [Drosophila busckii]